MDDLPSVSVVVPVFNDAAGLLRCLTALDKQSYPKELTEIIVADNGSSVDLTSCVSAFSNASLVREDKPGSYAARNRALQDARGAVLAFTDADCQPAEDWLHNAVQVLQRGRLDAVVGGEVELFPMDPAAPTWTESYELALGFPQRFYVEKRGYTVTANLITTKRVMDTVGPFDADLKSAGDKEWCHRAARAGYPIVHASNALVMHPARHSFKQLLGKKLRQASGQLGAASRRHSRWVAYFIVILTACAPPIMRMLRMRPQPGLGTLRRAQRFCVVWLMALVLQAATVLELIRRALGREARR